MNQPIEPALRAALQDMGPAQADPRGLPFHHRLDVLAKWLYARHRLGTLPQWAHLDVVDLYIRHIHLRTGGKEPGEEARKGDINAYLREFDALIDDMAAHGFDTRSPVLFSRSNHLPRNGAHRLATALAVGCDVAWAWDDQPGGTWGERWFTDHGFQHEEINLLLRAWAELLPEQVTVALLWSPVEAQWPALQAQLQAAGYATMAARTIELPRAALEELVRDVYAFDWGPKVGDTIEAKVRLLRGFAPRLRVLFLQSPEDAAPDLARSVKSQAREAAKTLAPVEWFATLHVSESAAEARHLLDMLASSNNLRRLAQRGTLRPGLVEMMAEMHEQITRRGIAPADCCIVGGAAVDAMGLRSADDIDFTLRPALRAKHFDRGIRQLAPRVDVVTFNYPRSFAPGQAASTDEQLLEDPSLHFMVRGFKVADPQVVLTRKQHQRRDKDLRDLPLLAGMLSR